MTSQRFSHGWHVDHCWRAPGDPPYVLDPEFRTGSEDVLATLEACRWLFPPATREVRGRQGDMPTGPTGPNPSPGAGVGLAPGRALGLQGSGVEAEAPLPEPPMAYDFAFLRTEAAQGVVGLLLAPSRAGGPGETFAAKFSRALDRFAVEAYKILTQPVIPEDERQTLVREAERAMQTLVESGRLNVVTDFTFCLEAFGVSRGRQPSEQQWLSLCLTHVLRAGLAAAPAADAARWRETARARMQHESAELYSIVDVRAWPAILELAGADHGAIDAEAFRAQVRLQLCMDANTRAWYEGLRQAASLIAELRQAASFGADELRELFNDRTHFERQHRCALLSTVLRNAPRALTQEVLRKIDDGDVDISERDDQEIILVRDLIQSLNEDIRCCKHAFFKMKSDWIAGRRSGVVLGEELSPEQVCDHIEHEDNHEELLRVAVNTCLRSNRKFEAARMLARPASKGTRVFETNRNDKQLAYLVSLYQDLEKPSDGFGPVEESCLVLPHPADELLYVDDRGEPLSRLERETLEGERTLAIGVWWFWRCFDTKLDLWPRASFIAIAYEQTLAIVDFQRLELASELAEAQGKDVVRRILEAPQLLKVVHDLDRTALQVLQRALVPHEQLVGDDAPPWPSIAPVVDLCLVTAFIRRVSPSASTVSKLSAITFDFLRLELCLAEALSNFEQRPLRLTQQHYALTLAWCPLMILRALCAHQVITQSELQALTLRVGLAGAPVQWDDMVRHLPLRAEQAHVEAEVGGILGETMTFLKGPVERNLWEDAEWRQSLPNPDRSFDLSAHVRQHLAPLVLPPQAASCADRSVASLFDAAVASSGLRSLFQAYHAHQRSQAGSHGGS